MTRPGTSRLLGTILIFLVLEIGSLFMVINDGPFQKARVSGVLFNVFSSVDRLSNEVISFVNLRKENNHYQQENLRLIRDIYKYQTLAEHYAYHTTDSTFLHKEESRKDSIFSFIPAKIITNSTSKLHNRIIVDKGRKDGIETDMGVITSNGVIGIITAVSDNYSSVISLLDIDQKLSARISSSNAAGTIAWEGKKQNIVTLNEIPLHISFNKTDTVYTSGFSSIFPPNIPIGSVESSAQVQGIHHKIEVKLFQDFSTLKYVTIVKNNHRAEIDSLIKGSNEQ